MRLLAWNIQHGGGSRIGRIVEEIAAYDAEVITLTEHRDRPGCALARELRERGWPYVETTGPDGNQNGVAAFSRTPMTRRPPPAESACTERWLEIDLPEHGFAVAALHIMAAGSSAKHPLNMAKARFWNATLAAAQERLAEPFLLVGDWNTGSQFLDETRKTYVCAEQFGRLSEIGWSDMWRRHNPGATEWTWYSRRKGGGRANGYRLDHCFATPSLAGRVTACRYSHAERDAGISDHSIMIVDVE